MKISLLWSTCQSNGQSNDKCTNENLPSWVAKPQLPPSPLVEAQLSHLLPDPSENCTLNPKKAKDKWSKFHPGGPQVAAPIDYIARPQQRSFCVFFRPLHFNHKISYVVDDFKIQFENLSRTGQKKKEMKMGKSNYWTIWCPISQIVEHFDFLAYFPNSPFSSYKIKSEILKAWKQVSIKHKGIN